MKRQNEIAKREYKFPSWSGHFPALFDTTLFNTSFDEIVKEFFTEDKFPMTSLLGASASLPCDVKVINDKDGKPVKTVVEYAAAGYDTSDIAVAVDDKSEELSISINKAEFDLPEKEGSEKVLQKRIAKRNFYAKYNLTGVDTRKITVDFKNGILRIELPHVDTSLKGVSTIRQILINKRPEMEDKKITEEDLGKL